MFTEALPDLLTYGTDSFLLVIAVRNLIVNRDCHEIQTLGSTVHELLQIALAEYTTDFALGTALVVPEISLKTIGGKHHGTATKLPLQAIRIQHSLLSANIGVFAGSLGFHNCQRQTIFAKQNIVHISHLTNYASHSLNRVFLLYIRIRSGKLPAHLLHIHIDINLAGFEFREVSRHEGTVLLVLLLSCGDLLRHLLDLLAQGFNLRIFFSEQTFLFFDFLCIDNDLFLGNQLFIKLPLLIVGAIAIVHPLDELKQSLQRSKSIAGLHTTFGMDSQVAQLNDKRQFSPGVVVHSKPEGGFVDQGLEVVLVGHLHGVIGRIDPFDRQFQRLAAANRAHSRSRSIDFLRLNCGWSKQRILLIFM